MGMKIYAPKFVGDPMPSDHRCAACVISKRTGTPRQCLGAPYKGGLCKVHQPAAIAKRQEATIRHKSYRVQVAYELLALEHGFESVQALREHLLNR